ncbi:hypothetical protein [Bradyrhizobium sp. USDA 4451]
MPKHWSTEEERRLLELRENGLTWIRVARLLGRTEASVVGRYLKHLKNKRQPRKIVCRPKLRLPSRNPLLELAAAVLARNRQLRAELIDRRWRAVALESRLQALSDNLAREMQRAKDNVGMRSTLTAGSAEHILCITVSRSVSSSLPNESEILVDEW